MDFKNCSVYNFDGALRGMRNPLNSWKLSDSNFGVENWDCVDSYASDWAWDWMTYDGYEYDTEDWDRLYNEYKEKIFDKAIIKSYDNDVEFAEIGPKDMQLAKKLIAAGPEHRKFLRQIFVSIDITAPLYWWKEIDQYKIGTTTNGCSTMHKLADTPITIDCFEIGDFNNIEYPNDEQRNDLKYPVDEDVIQMIFIPYLEYLRTEYNRLKKVNPEKAKKYWKELVRWLPEGWLQTRTWTGNYETLRSMYHQRNNHKLVEWHEFCNFIESLPYSKEFIIE